VSRSVGSATEMSGCMRGPCEGRPHIHHSLTSVAQLGWAPRANLRPRGNPQLIHHLMTPALSQFPQNATVTPKSGSRPL
jgi:hypothetical protein